MLAHMKTQITDGLTEISLTVPTEMASKICDAISSLLQLADIRPVNEEGEKLYTIEEVFPEANPGMALRGLRAREGITQKQLATVLGIQQTRVSEIENGVRPISVDMAKRIGKAYNISYKAFL